jgi:hypothetical protein
VTSAVTQYTTRLLTPDTWDDFAALAEANNGVWGGCWCIGGPPAEVASIKNPRAYEKGLAELPDWRIGCLFTGSGSRRAGVARAGVAAALAAIAHAGGGLVEAYPEQVAERDPQRGAYLHTGPESLFEEFGFVRDRRIAKWRWVMRLTIQDNPL